MPKIHIPGVSVQVFIPEDTNNPEVITQVGGAVKDGEAFTVLYTLGGLTGATGININGIPCTSFQSISDTSVSAVAPSDNLMHTPIYSMRIF